MATAGDGRAPYESSGAGGKFRKRPIRRSAPATPYDRPPTALRNNNPGLLTKLVDPASRLISAGANKLFGVFRKRLPPLSLQGLPEINEEPMNVSHEAEQNNSIQVGNSASISAATGISDLEQMLKQKTFTRSEIQHLTALLHSRTTESPADNTAKRHEASTSGSLKIHNAISTPVITSSVFQEETTSPADLAKAYMGSRPTKSTPSPLGSTIQDSKLTNYTTTLQKTQITTTTPHTANNNNFKGLENGFLTPRSRGRSAMYSMARTPYTKSPLNFNQKEIMSSSSQSLKRRSSVLDDDFGSGGPLRRTRQKPNLLLQSKRELGPMLLRNEPEQDQSNRSNQSTISQDSVPIKSTETATRIFQQLEKMTPKKSPNKLTSNMLHGQALRSLEKVELPKFVDTSHDTKKLEAKNKNKEKEKVIEENGERKFPVPVTMLTTTVNGDVDLEVSKKDNLEIVKIDDDLTSKIPIEPPQKKRAFQMSAPDLSWEFDDDVITVNGHVEFPLVENDKPEINLALNKPVSNDIIEATKLPEASRTPELVTPAVVREVIPVAKSPEPVELKEAEKATQFFGGNFSDQENGFKFPATQTSVLPPLTTQKDEATPTKKVSPFQFSPNEVSESKPKESSDSKPLDSTSVFSSITKTEQFKVSNKDENGNNQKLENIFGKSDSLSPAVVPASSTNGVFSFASSATNADSSLASFPLSGGNTNSVLNNSSSDFTPTSTSGVSSTSLTPPVFSFGSGKPISSVVEPANTEKETKSTISSSPFATSAATTSGGGLFGFSSPATTSTAATSGGALFGFSAPAATSTATTTTNGGAVFGFSSAAATSTTATTTSGGALFGFSAPAATSTAAAATSGGAIFGFSAPAASSTATTSGGALFGFSAPAAASTTTTTSGGLFGFSSPAAASTTATTTSGGAFFGFSAPAAPSTTTTSLFGFSAPAATSTTTTTTTSGALFGFSAPAATSTTTTPFQFASNSTSSTSLFNSSTPTFGIAPIPATSEGKSVNSTTAPTTPIFGSTWQPQPNPPTFSFGASSSSATSSPITFGQSTTNPPTSSSSMFSFTSGPTKPSFTPPSQLFGTPTTPVFVNNNDQMSMEDTMAEDSMQTPSPNPVSPFGQTPAPSPGFMFGSAAAAPPQQAAAPFQFGGQPPPPQNPFQSSSVEFNGGGGSFSLGSGGGDKSGRRIVKINKNKNRRK